MSRNNPTNNNNDKIAATSSGEDVNDSPESSLEPEEVEQTINKIETSFASNQPVTRSLSSVTNNNKSKLPLPKSVISNGSSNGTHSVNNQNRINTKKTDLEKISPWLVSSDAIHTKKEKEKTKIPQLKTVITTEL